MAWGTAGQTASRFSTAAAGAAGEIEDQGAIADSADGAREHGEGSFGQAGGAHGFTEAGDDAIEHLLGRLRSNIARRKPVPPVVTMRSVSPESDHVEGTGDERLLVGDQRAVVAISTCMLGEPVG